MRDGNPGPDEAPAPPTSTGWSGEGDAHDDELAPPFVPGGAEPAAAEPEAAEPEPAPEPGTAPDQVPVEAEEAEPLAAPFEPAAAEPEAEETSGERFPFETGWDAAEEEEEDEETAAAEEDTFPVEAFDIQGEGPSGGTESAPVAPRDAEAAETREMEAAREVAGRLEEMARRLRDQGPDAARAELESSDRFTALLAGLLAGYLAGKE